MRGSELHGDGNGVGVVNRRLRAVNGRQCVATCVVARARYENLRRYTVARVHDSTTSVDAQLLPRNIGSIGRCVVVGPRDTPTCADVFSFAVDTGEQASMTIHIPCATRQPLSMRSDRRVRDATLVDERTHAGEPLRRSSICAPRRPMHGRRASMLICRRLRQGNSFRCRVVGALCTPTSVDVRWSRCKRRQR